MSGTVGRSLLVIVAMVFTALPPDDVGGFSMATVQRPFSCQSSDVMYVDCFLCGRLTNDKRVYVSCCAGIKTVNEYCSLLLA